MAAIRSASIDVVAAVAAIFAAAASGFVANVLVQFREATHTHYVAARSRGIKGFFLRHMPEVMSTEPAAMAEIRFFNEARAAGKKAALYGMTCFHPTYTLVDPVDVQYVLVKRAGFYPKPGVYEALKLFIGEHGLVTERDEAKHAIMRRLVNPAFKTVFLKSLSANVFQPGVAALLQDLRSRIQSHATTPDQATADEDDQQTDRPGSRALLEVESTLTAFALRVICKAAFRFHDEKAVETISNGFFALTALLQEAPWLLVPAASRVPHSALTRVIAALDTQKRNIRVIIDAMRRDQKKGQQQQPPASPIRSRPDAPNDADDDGHDETGATVDASDRLIDIMLREQQLTDDVVISHGVTFLFAGHDTTSLTLNSACYCLARYPEVQNRLFEEIASCVAFNTIPTYDTVSDLVYLDSFLREVLRLHCPVTGFGRLPIEDDVLPSGLFLPKGHEIWFSIVALQRLPEFYGADAENFRPERWCDDVEDRAAFINRAEQYSMAYLPFSIGKRNCIGKDFAMMELKVCTAALVRQLQFALIAANYVKPPDVQGVTRRPATPIELLVSIRDGADAE